jgi:hypothetical protein
MVVRMSPLERYQRELLGYVYAPSPGEPPASIAAQSKTPSERLALGLTIYRRNLIYCLCRALAETYPLCRDLLGEGNFNFLGKQYVHRFPSRVRDLGDYGERFADFLAQREEVRDHPFLSDLARLEWLADRAVRLPRAAWLDERDLALPASGEERARRLARLRRAVLPLRVRFTVLDVWRDYQRGGCDAIRAESLRPGAQHLLVWSRKGRPQATEADPKLWREIAGAEVGVEP